MTMGQRIKFRREELGISQRELAEKLGYKNNSTLSGIESGKVDLTQSRIVAIAKALGVTPSWLIGWEEEKQEGATMTIGDKIRTARENKKMSQEELGKLVGVQRSAVAKWEKGRVVNIKRDKLQQLAAILDIPAYELVMEDSQNMEPAISHIKQEIAGLVNGMSEEELQTVLKYIKFIKQGD